MSKLPFVLLATSVTFLSWGLYGILLHEGQHLMKGSAMRSFVGVGIAYFLVAVLVPAFLMSNKKEKGYWSFFGVLMSLFAGSVGALGALGVLLALTFKGSPLYVMPLVFGFAPVVNTVVTMWLGKTFKQMNMIFVVGMVMVAIGAVGVLVTKPSLKPVAHVAESDGTETDSKEEKSAESKEKGDHSTEKSGETAAKPNTMAVVLSIVMAAICWGSYGPFLHIGQMKMGGSRLRPFFCVGLAYFAIAVAAPLALLSSYPDDGIWSFFGMTWSIAAGTAGAIGALGIIMAFNFGGKPIFVMPLVFGFAPVVNTLVSIYINSAMDRVRPEFIVCLGIVVLGAVTVLLFAPKGKPHGAAPSTSKPEGASTSEPSTGTSGSTHASLPSTSPANTDKGQASIEAGTNHPI